MPETVVDPQIVCVVAIADEGFGTTNHVEVVDGVSRTGARLTPSFIAICASGIR